MANAKASMFQKLMNNPQMMKVAEQMFNSMNDQGRLNFVQRPNIAAALHTPGSDDALSWLQGENPGSIAAQALAGSGPAVTGDVGGTLGDFGSLALNAAKAHPFRAAGLGAGLMSNIGGLTDNSYYGGQLGGLALGGLGAATLASGNPYAQAMLTLGGGSLGSLFDKLRAKKEQEPEQQFNQNYLR